MIVSLLRTWKASQTLPAIVPVTRNFKSNALILAKDNRLIPFQGYRIADFHCENRPPDHVVSSTQQFRPSSIDVRGPEVVYFWDKLKKCFGSKKGDKKKGGKKAKKQSCKKKKCGKQKDTCLKKKDSCEKSGEKKECKTTEGKQDVKKEAKKDDPCKKKEEKKKDDPCKKKDVKKEDPCKKKEEKKEDPCKKKDEKKKEDPCKKKEEKKKEDPCKKKEEKKEDPCKKKEDPCKKKDKKKEDPCKKKEEKKEDPCKKKEVKKDDPCKKKEDPCKKKEEKKDDPCKKKEDPCKKKEEKKDDPCKKKEDPCKKKEEKKADPCKKKEDPCKKKEDPCKKKEEKKDDPCKKKEDPCKKKEEKKVDPCDPCKKKEKEKDDPCEPCKKKEDPCKKFIPNTLPLQDPFVFFARSNSTGKKEEERCSKPCRDPCAEGACDVLPGQDEPCNSSASWKIKVRPCRRSSPGQSKRGQNSPNGPCMIDKVDIVEQKLEPESKCDLTKHPCGKKVCPNKCEVKRKTKFSHLEEDPKVAVGNLLDLLSYQTRAFQITQNLYFANARGTGPVPPSWAPNPKKPAAGSGVPRTAPPVAQNYSERVSGLLEKLKALWQGSAPNPGEGGTQQVNSDKSRPQPRTTGKRLFGMVESGAAVAGDRSSQSVSAAVSLESLSAEGDSHILFMTDDFEKCEDRFPPCPLEPETLPCPAPKEEACRERSSELWSDIDANWGYERFPWKSDVVKEERLDEVSQGSDDPYANNHL